MALTFQDLENELAIRRHERAIVEEQMRTSSSGDPEQEKRLSKLRSDLTHRIEQLEQELKERSSER